MKNKFSMAMTLAVILAMVLTSLALADATPTIVSDLPDYGPGDIVNLFGGGWQAGESVRIFVNDNVGSSWSRNVDVVAADDGTFTDTFTLPSWFVASYSVTATGGLSGTVTTSFTDAGATISGTVLNDADGDGVDDGESGLANATITIYKDKTGGSGIVVGSWDPTDTIQAGPFTTTSSGTWSAGVPVGNTYFVVEVDPTGYTSTNSFPGSDNSSNIATSKVDNNQLKVVVASFGGPTVVTSSGNKFLDHVTDSTAPTASPTQSPAANGAGWNNSDVTVNWNWADNVGGSGIDSANCTTSSASSGEGTITLSANCKDLAGNTGSASYTVKVDKTKPVITGSRTPAANPNGWNNTDVVVSFICADSGGSGIATNTVAGATLIGEGAGQSVTNTGICTDNAANTANSATVGGINIDKTKPTISAAIFAGTLGSNGWYVSDVTVRFTCADNLSGVVACPADQVLNTEGTGISSAALTVTDAAGNTSNPSNVVTVDIDKTKPTISAAISASTLGLNSWYVSNVTVHFTCNDGGSGIPANACPADQVLNTEGMNISSTAQSVTDAAGNTSALSNVVTVNIDKTAPGVSCASADGLWHDDDVSIACTASDGVSGLANAADANFSLTTNVPAGTEDNNASTNSHTVFDVAGNSTVAGPVSGNMVDKKAPQLSSCDLPDGVWHASDVTLYCHYTDGGSGPATQDVSLVTNVAVGTETSNALASAGGAQACDGVGNCATSPADIAGNKIDKKAPSITITTPANGSSYLLNQVVTSVFNCADGGSGVANCSGPATVDTASTGSTKTFTVNATDHVGNSDSASTTYSVSFKICALYDQTKSHKAGSTVPLKLQVCDANGVNYSSAAIVVKALAVTKLDTSAGPLDDSGAANSPDMNFRYDATLGGSGGYIFNLSTKGLTTGTWKVTFSINGATDPSYFVKFDIK